MMMMMMMMYEVTYSYLYKVFVDNITLNNSIQLIL